MSLHQTLQTSTRKTNELFDKLAATSNQAVKTREGLFSELSRELRLHTDLQERHVFPALRKREDTKGLVTEAAKVNKELRADLDELEALPKGDEAFLPRLANLRKLFKQHLRDERKEFATVEEELSDEQAEAVARKIEAGLAAAEEEQRQEAEARRLVAKRERELEEATARRTKAAVNAIETTTKNVRELGSSAADAVQRGVHSVEETSQKVAKSATKTAERVKHRAVETLTAYRNSARERGDDVKAVAGAFRTLGNARSDVRALFVEFVKRSGRNGLEVSKQVLRNPLKFGEAQREYAAAATRNWLETTSELMQIARRASVEAARPVDQRLRAVA